MRGERAELFDDTSTILSPFIYRKGTITYFLWSEYNQIFTLWQFHIGHHSVYGSFPGNASLSMQFFFWGKKLTGQYRLRMYTDPHALLFIIHDFPGWSNVLYHLSLNGNEQKGHSLHRVGNWDYSITSFVVKCLRMMKIDIISFCIFWINVRILLT